MYLETPNVEAVPGMFSDALNFGNGSRRVKYSGKSLNIPEKPHICDLRAWVIPKQLKGTLKYLSCKNQSRPSFQHSSSGAKTAYLFVGASTIDSISQIASALSFVPSHRTSHLKIKLKAHAGPAHLFRNASNWQDPTTLELKWVFPQKGSRANCMVAQVPQHNGSRQFLFQAVALKKQRRRTQKVAELIKCFLCKNEDLSFDSQHPHKESKCSVAVCKTSIGEQKQEGLTGHPV